MKTYPAYKDSPAPWLDKVPAHWGIMPAFSVLREKRHKNIGMIENTVLSLSYGNLVIKPPEKLHGLVPESFETYQIVDPGNIIIRPTDLQNDWTSLRVGLSKHRGIITSAYICLQAFGKIIPEYAYLLLHAYDLLKVFYGMGSGLRQNLGFDDLKRMPVLLPSLDEQRAIVAFLDTKLADIAHFIAEKERLIALLQEQKTGLINQAVTRGLNPQERMKDSGIEWLGNIPEHWQTKKLRHITKILRGKFSHRPRNDPDLYDGAYPFIQTGDVASANKYITEFHQTLNEKGFAVSKQFPKGSLVMTIAANIGDVAILNFEACFPDSIVGFVPKQEVLLDYLYVLLKGMKQEFLKESPASTQMNLNVDRISSQWIPLPPIEEQTTILEYIENRMQENDSVILRTQREMDLMKEYRTALIAEAVTGKIDVRM